MAKYWGKEWQQVARDIRKSSTAFVTSETVIKNLSRRIVIIYER